MFNPPPATPRDTHIAIIGGGIGGCCLAATLQKRHFTNVKIYEKDSGFSSRRQGYGLTIQQACTALNDLGITDLVREIDTPNNSHCSFNQSGDLLGFFGRTFSPLGQKKPKKYNLHLPRQMLRQFLVDRLQPGTICWNKKLISLTFKDETQKTELSFSDGTTTTADLVVGADGVYSVVRRILQPTLQLNYLGVIVILGITTNSFPLMKQRTVQTVDGTVRLFSMPFGAEEIMWQISFMLPEQEAIELCKSPAQLKKAVIDRCATWHSPVPEMLQATNFDLVMGCPAYDCDHEIPPFNGSVVLIGDSAHPMSPFKGQGANQAMLDAVVLTRLIARLPLAQALQEFYQEMKQRARTKVEASRQQVLELHTERVLSMFLERTAIDPKFLTRLRELKIGSWSGDQIDSLILNEMKDWGLTCVYDAQ